MKEKTETIFYVGKRRKRIIIDELVKMVVATIDEISANEKDEFIKRLIDGIKNGETDKYLMRVLPLDKNAYYNRKKRIVDKIYQCCIFKGLINYEEILNESIG